MRVIKRSTRHESRPRDPRFIGFVHGVGGLEDVFKLEMHVHAHGLRGDSILPLEDHIACTPSVVGCAIGRYGHVNVEGK